MPGKQTKSPRDFMNKVFIENTLWAQMEPSFRWLSMFPTKPTDARRYTYKKQTYNMYTDPKKQKPAKAGTVYEVPEDLLHLSSMKSSPTSKARGTWL